MDWFERLTGFAEGSYDYTRERLEVLGRELRSRINGRSYGIGEFELISLQNLRERATSSGGPSGRLIFRNVSGDVRSMHQNPEYAGALFQVASQFNLLEMVSPDISPEDGVTRYQNDRTQGPACAIAAGAATIYRNYFVPTKSGYGQARTCQLDGLGDIGVALGNALGLNVETLWSMRNGYALCRGEGLDAIAARLRAMNEAETDMLRGLLRIGVHAGVEVTDGDEQQRCIVSQAFCSALPVAYTTVSAAQWEPFAELVLEAAYEATLWAAVLNAQRNASNVALLTRLGGGAFGNKGVWIDSAMRRVLEKFREFDLDIRLVSYRDPPASMLTLEADFQ